MLSIPLTPGSLSVPYFQTHPKFERSWTIISNQPCKKRVNPTLSFALDLSLPCVSWIIHPVRRCSPPACGPCFQLAEVVWWKLRWKSKFRCHFFVSLKAVWCSLRLVSPRDRAQQKGRRRVLNTAHLLWFELSSYGCLMLHPHSLQLDNGEPFGAGNWVFQAYDS